MCFYAFLVNSTQSLLQKVKYLYDVLDRIEKIQYNINGGNNFETVFSYEYDAQGRIRSITDHRTNEVTMYQYDSKGKLDSSFARNRKNSEALHLGEKQIGLCLESLSFVFYIKFSSCFFCLQSQLCRKSSITSCRWMGERFKRLH